MQIEDETLVSETLVGSQLAFGVLINRYERLIHRICMRHCHASNEAMDLTQDIFLKVHSRLRGFNGSGSFKGWMLRLAHNECVDWLRKHRHEHLFVNLEDVELPASESAPESELNRQQSRRVLQIELAKLSEKHRLAVSLRYFEQFSLNEIAEVLECTEGTVKSILFRALSKLRGRVAFQRREEYV